MRPYYYLGGRRGMTQLSTGQLFLVNTDGSDLATWIIHLGIWEGCVDDLLCALVRPGDTFLDVGANIGYYTVKLGPKVGPSGRVFSFEPNPDLFEVLHDNIQLNQLGGHATAFMAGASDREGAASLLFASRYPGGGVLGLGAEFDREGTERVDVRMVRVDDVVEGPAHLIKIDVEGFEPVALKGMEALLARSPDVAIVCEVAYHMWAQHGDPAQMVSDLAKGRRLFRIFTDGWLEEVAPGAIDGALSRDLVSYFLFLPATEARYRQIASFVVPPGRHPSRPRSMRVSARAVRFLKRLKLSLMAH
jgi:FkbM family methyltransferase